jgi:hypothetical protein
MPSEMDFHLRDEEGDLYGGRTPLRHWIADKSITLRNGLLCWSQNGRMEWVAASNGLLEAFIKLSHGSSTRVLSFAKNWGVLGLCDHAVPFTHDADCTMANSESIEQWRALADAARSILLISAKLYSGKLGGPSEWAPIAKVEMRWDSALSDRVGAIGRSGFITTRWRDVRDRLQACLKRVTETSTGEDQSADSLDELLLDWLRPAPFLSLVDARRLGSRPPFGFVSVGFERQAFNAFFAHNRLRGMSSADLKGAGKLQRAHVARFLTKWIRMASVRPLLSWHEDPRPYLTLRPPIPRAGLFSGLGIQLVQAIAKSPGLGLCSSCGNVFTPRRQVARNRRSYCPDCGKQAACRDASRAYRARKARTAEGTNMPAAKRFARFS